MALSIDIEAQDNTKQVFDTILNNIRNSATIAEEQADAAGVALHNAFQQSVSAARASGSDMNAALKEQFEQIVANSGEMGEGIRQMIGKNFEKGFEVKTAKANLAEIEKQLAELKSEVDSFPAMIGKTESKLEEVKQKREEIVEWWQNTSLDMDDPVNIAKYKQALQEVDTQIQNLENSLYSMREGQAATNDVYDHATASYYILSAAIDEAEQSKVKIRKRMGEVRQEMLRLAEAGQTDTEQYRKLREEAIKLQKTFMETNRSLGNAAKQGAALSGVLQGLNAISGAYSAGVGVMSLFNDDMEKNAEIQKDLQAMIAVTTGLQSIYNATTKTGALMQGIISIQSKAAAKAKDLETAATGRATIVQKIFNAVAKANPYVLLAMAIISVVGALAMFVSRSNDAKKAQEEQAKALEKLKRKYERKEEVNEITLKTMKAEGATEEELAAEHMKMIRTLQQEAQAQRNDLDWKVKNWKTDKDVTEARKEQIEVLDELISKYEKEWESARLDEKLRLIELQRKAQEELLKLEQDIYRERINIAKRETDNKKKQIDLQTQAEVNAIREHQKEYNKQYGASTESDAKFNQQVNQVYINAKLDKKAVDKEFEDMLKNLQEQAEKSNIEIQLATLNDALDNTEGLEQRLSLLKQIYEVEKQIELTELERKRQEDLEKAKNESGSEQEYKQRAEQVNAAYDVQANNIQQKYEMAYNKEEVQEKKDALDKKLEAYTQYAEQVVAIEEELQERLKAIDNSNLSEDEKQQARTAATNEAGYMTDQAAYETLGMAAEEIPQELADIVAEVFNMSLEELQAEIPQLQAELQRLKKSGQDTSAMQAKLNSAMTRAKTLQGQIGDKSKDSGDKMKKNYSAAVNTLQNITTACKDIKDAFSEYLGDTAADALDTMQNVAQGAIAMITGLQTLSTAAATEISTVEKASVILTVIAAAIQVTMAIVNAFVKNFSKNAQIQAQIDKNKAAIEDLKRAEKELEYQQKSQTGRKYWQDQWKQIKNASDQAEKYAENMRLAQEQMNNASTKKKKEKAQDNLDEATEGWYDQMNAMQDKIDEFYDQMIGTDLESFAGGLADSIMEGFEDGLSDMGQVWDNAFDDLMKQMLTQQISMELQDKLKAVFDRIKAAFSEDDTELDRSEIDAIKAEYEAAKQEAEERINAYKELYDELGLGINDSEEGSKGGFESMSQDTADELNARFTALQMEGAAIQMLAEKMQVSVEDIQRMLLVTTTYQQRTMEDTNLGVQIMQDQLTQLEIIAANTSALELTNIRLKNIEANTDRI